jgi:hypothetical protein
METVSVLFFRQFEAAAAQIEQAGGAGAGTAKIRMQLVVHESTVATDLDQLSVFQHFEVV